MAVSQKKYRKIDKNRSKSIEKEKIFYGLIEKIDDNTFFAVIINIARGQSCSAEAHSITETKNKLKNNIRKKLREMGIEYSPPIRLELTEVNIETPECSV